MFSMLLFATALAGLAIADPTPTGPGGTDTFTVGGNCTIQWTADPTGQWTQMAIELMSGNNNPMTHLRTVAIVDATQTTSYSWACPDVSPYSTIYFYQFSHAAKASNLLWTTRFTITGADGTSTPPTGVASNGAGYGNGTFVDTSLYNAQPAWELNNGQLIGGGAAAGTSTNSTSSPSTSPSASPSGTSPSPSGTSVGSSNANATPSLSPSKSSSSTPPSGTSQPNSAMSSVRGLSLAAVVAPVLAVYLFVL